MEIPLVMLQTVITQPC